MDPVELSRRLPLSQSSFEDLRALNKIYVDKTALVYALASDVNKIFLARPRRFGKSLLVSTFESLFKHGLRDFRGLAIEKKWNDKGTYNVLRLDFSNVRAFSDIEDFRFQLNDYLLTAFEAAGFIFPQTKGTIANNFTSWVTENKRLSVVLLIDEYDAPLTAKLNDTVLFNAVRDELFAFYTVIKSQTGFFRFVFMTGITKFSETGIFSVLNDLTDISLSRTYATLLGYTQSELRTFFGEHIVHAADKLGMTCEQVFECLEENYDGYCFDGLSGTPHEPEHVYTPWSILNFLFSPQDGFKNYWMTSGGKTQLLTQYFKEHSLKTPEEYGEDKLVAYADLDGSSDLDTINDVALLTQAGYLTIKERINEDDLLVGYPNREVADSMAKLYASLLLKQKTISAVGARYFVHSLKTGNVELAMREINKIFLAINYERYPVKSEAAVQACLQVFATGAGFNVTVEKHNAYGRSDLELDAGDFHWVFDLKYLSASGTPAEERRLLTMAESQMASRHYGETEHASLIRIATVFSASQRQFVLWQRIGLN